MEIWLPIEDFPNYEVSSTGKVRNRNTGRILSPGNNAGYQQVNLCRNGKHYNKHIHVLVANAFYDITEFECNVTKFGCEVHHKDLKKCNNCVHNLEFLSTSEHKGKHPIPRPGRKVRIIETGEIFDNAHTCARYIYGHQSHISECLRGNTSRKTHKGFSFEYYEDQ